jgi:hypothetical protein
MQGNAPNTLPAFAKMDITPALSNQVRKYAGTIMQYRYAYTKAQIMDKLLTGTAGDVSRAQKGFYLLVKTKAIIAGPAGKYFLSEAII